MPPLRVLHLSHHDGCIADFEYVSSELGFDVRSYKFDDGYNIGPERADSAWERWRDRFCQADVVLVSDTAPLARIVMQHLDEYEGHLVVWVCNRFDYADEATNDCGFPDADYYALFRRASLHPRVHIAPYTPFEYHYARRFGVELGEQVIKPIGRRLARSTAQLVPPGVDKAATVFVPPYHNDSVMMDLAAHVSSLGAPAYCGRYGGPEDLVGFRAVVHIPYAWSTFAFFETLQNAIPMFVPSRVFLLRLARRRDFWWQQARMLPRLQRVSEWYAPAHDFFVYFHSWRDLRRKLRRVDLDEVRHRM
ncbi:MAG: hypothetical protein ACYC0H_05675, partial [Solirubrobacteraceae bacterium]